MNKASLSVFATLLLSSFAAHAGDDLFSSTIDLEGVAFQSGKIAKASSDNDNVQASPVYQYAITGTVTGSGTFSFIPSGTDIGTVLNQIQPGFAENLGGTIVNPSGKLPFIVVNKKLKGSFDVGPVTASVTANVQAGITKKGQTSFSFTDVKVTTNGFPLPVNGKITFDAGSTCRVFVPEGRNIPSQPDLIIAAGKEDAVGNNIYNTSGSGQAVSVSLKKNQSYSFNLLVQNDGTAADGIVITGPKGDDDVTISYKMGKKNVTSKVTGTDGLTLAGLPSLGGKVLKVTAKAKKDGASFAGTITATGANNFQDVVAINVGEVAN